MKKIIGIFALLSLGFSSQAANIYVDHTITAPGANGTSWTLAYSTVDAALLVAVSGDVIKVSEGTYPAGAGRYFLKEGVRMYGGYPAPGTVYYLFREMFRNGDTYPTLLTGSEGIKVTAALSAATYVDGFQIQGTNVGLQLFNSSTSSDVIAPVFANCTFTGVYAGVQISHLAATVTPQFNGCKFTGSNRGLYISFRQPSQLVAPNFSKCEFFANIRGASFESWTGVAYPKFTDCIFRDNTSYAIINEGPGIGATYSTFCPATSIFDYHPEFINSKFYNNAGILDASVTIACKPDLLTIFSNCTFNDNAPIAGAPAFNLADNSSGLQPGTNISVFTLNNCISSNNLYNGALIQLGTAMVCHIENSMIESLSCNSSGLVSEPAYILLNPHNLVHQVKSSLPLNNIYAGNPLYINPASAIPDLRLQSSSPARNTGRNSLIPFGVSTDFSGLLRQIEGTVDMGAHEYCPSLGMCYPTATPRRTSSTELTVAKENSLEVNTYPNPVQDVLNIEMSEEAEVHVRIINAIGQLMISESFTGRVVKFDFSAYPVGIYTVFVNDQYSQSVHRVVKR